MSLDFAFWNRVRFGLSGFNIRGIEGDRVQILIDGIRTPDEFASGGPFLDSRRDYVDIDLIESVEILKGAGSSLYGSDAIGGVVSFNTRRPSSYVTDNEPYIFLTNLVILRKITVLRTQPFWFRWTWYCYSCDLYE